LDVTGCCTHLVFFAQIQNIFNILNPPLSRKHGEGGYIFSPLPKNVKEEFVK